MYQDIVSSRIAQIIRANKISRDKVYRDTGTGILVGRLSSHSLFNIEYNCIFLILKAYTLHLLTCLIQLQTVHSSFLQDSNNAPVMARDLRHLSVRCCSHVLITQKCLIIREYVLYNSIRALACALRVEHGRTVHTDITDV